MTHWKVSNYILIKINDEEHLAFDQNNKIAGFYTIILPSTSSSSGGSPSFSRLRCFTFASRAASANFRFSLILSLRLRSVFVYNT